MFPIVFSKLQPQRPYLLQWITLQISISRLFLVVPSKYPSRDPHNTNGYVASRITPFVCHPTRNQPPTIRIPQAIPQSTPQAIPQVIPQVILQAIPQAIPLSTVAIQAPVVPQWRQRLDDVTILYCGKLQAVIC